MASSDALLRRLLPDRLSLGAAAAAAALVAVVSYHLAELSSELFLVRRRDADQQQQQLRSVDAPCEDDVGSAGYTTRSLPGGRRVETPYGTIQVYEAGPHDGRRVLFVHGISTPCIALANIAARLAEDGCRVMLFGTWVPSANAFLPLVPCTIACGGHRMSCTHSLPLSFIHLYNPSPILTKTSP